MSQEAGCVCMAEKQWKPEQLFLNTFCYTLLLRKIRFTNGCVSWLKEHNAKFTAYGKPVEEWWKDSIENSLEPFAQIQALCQSVTCEVKYELQTVYADHNIRPSHVRV